jgi:chaperone modulatory protein CbpM
MNPQAHECLWLDEQHTVGMPELSRACGLSAAELLELIDYGALAPMAGQADPPLFSTSCITPLREAARVRSDFDLDLFAIAILLGYIHRIDDLQRELHAQRAQLPSHLHPHRDGPAAWHESHAGGAAS